MSVVLGSTETQSLEFIGYEVVADTVLGLLRVVDLGTKVFREQRVFIADVPVELKHMPDAISWAVSTGLRESEETIVQRLEKQGDQATPQTILHGLSRVQTHLEKIAQRGRDASKELS